MKGQFLTQYDSDFVGLLNVDLPALVPATLWRKLDKYRENDLGLKRYLKRNHNTIVEIEYAPNIQGSTVSGLFDQIDECMSIFIVRSRHLNQKQWDSMKFEIIITLMHEYVHFMQWIQSGEDTTDLVLFHKEHKNPKIQEEREYYSSWGEIQAYAHCVLMEMWDRNTKRSVSDMLQSKKVGYYSPTLRQVKSHFDGFDYPLRYLYREVLRWEKRYIALNMRNSI